MHILGIKRSTRFSPNHIGNDDKIFNLVATHLQSKGCSVTSMSEDDFLASNFIDEKYIFNLIRETESIEKLKKLCDNGAIIVNSPLGIENCRRGNMTTILLNNNIPHPKSWMFEVNDDLSDFISKNANRSFWVKRGDLHVIHREDVAYARNTNEVLSIIEEFKYRNIPNVVINEHLKGDLVKFYGVKNTDFFYWFYPNDSGHEKFKLEEKSLSQQFPFSIKELQKVAIDSAKLLNVDIYGGDCIVDENGSFKIIDFNDWPSFAPCRDEAAPYIAQCILSRFNE